MPYVDQEAPLGKGWRALVINGLLLAGVLLAMLVLCRALPNGGIWQYLCGQQGAGEVGLR